MNLLPLLELLHNSIDMFRTILAFQLNHEALHCTAFVYVYEGSIQLGLKPPRAKRNQLAVLGPGSHIDLSGGSTGARVILVAGRPCNEPVARYGPFVMNTEEEIRQAFADYQAGCF